MITDQPNPIAGQGDVLLSVIESVKLLTRLKPDNADEYAILIEMLEERRQVGIDRYGAPLQTFNGRDAFMDLMQELLDASAYIQQYVTELCYERDACTERKAMEDLRTNIMHCCATAAGIFKTFRRKQ